MAYPIPKEEYAKRIDAAGRCKFISFYGEFKNARSRANVSCIKCGFEWHAYIHTLTAGRSGCKKCATANSISAISLGADVYESRVNNSGFAKFVKWNSGSVSAKSKITALCTRCNKEFITCPDQVKRGAGCPHCVGDRISETKRVDDSFWIEKINAAGDGSFVFSHWVDGFKNAFSRAIIECNNGHLWNSTPDSISHGSGCPRCARRGFDQTSDAYLYAMMSDCGRFVKIGISGALEKRLRNLKLSTPFDFSVYSLIKMSGKEAMRMEKSIHTRHERAGLSGFDGCTEWMTVTDEIMNEIRTMGR